MIQGYIFDNYLIKGFQEGFHLGNEGPRKSNYSPNLKSCKEVQHIISEKVAFEIELGRIRSPFVSLPFPHLQVSPIGCVPKRKLGPYRLIQHLSYPKGSSINGFICDELCTVKYSTFDDAVSLVLTLCPGALMAKTDIDCAFRIIPVHPDEHELLGFK